MPLPAADPSPEGGQLPNGADLPDGEELRRRERQARSGGSDLDTAALVGRWRFQQVWPRAGGAPRASVAALLRSLDASLEIGPGPARSPADAQPLRLANRVALGAVELRFDGAGTLSGPRPLLRFWFARWQLRLAGRTLLGGALPRPEQRRLPFFALIARGTTPGGTTWLAARGRGGGLALWCLDPVTALAPATAGQEGR